MGQAVNTARSYDSTLRREQAKRTRGAVLEAAGRLFLGRGYTETTIVAIAEAAGVSAPTVYKLFGNKARLLKAVFDVAIVGDDKPTPMLQREFVAVIREEADPRGKLRLYGDHLAKAGPRAGRFQLLIRSVADSHQDARAVWEQMVTERLVGMTAFAQDLRDGGYLRHDVSVEAARDVLWTYNSVELYDLLVLQRGWETDRYGRWIAEALIDALLPKSSFGP